MKREQKIKNINNSEAGRMVNFRPVFASVCFLVAGIFISYYRMVEGKMLWWLLVIAMLSPWLFFLAVKNKTRFFVYLLVFYLSFFFGSSSFSLSVGNYRDCAYYNGEYYVSGTIVEKNVLSTGGELVLTDLTVDGNTAKGRLTVKLYEEDFEALKFCDEVCMRLSVSTRTTIVGAYGFRAEAIANKNLFSGSDVVWYEVTGRAFRPGAYIRGEIQSALYRGMGEESASVATAILLGNTSGIEEGLLENIRYGGIAHIFAVSGLHIGAVFAFFVMLFRGNRIPAPIRFVFTAAGLLLYGGVCGYSASVVRAIVTCLVLYACTLLGIKYDSLESLSLAAYIVFGVYPTLLFGVGAQLSFCACLGILLMARPTREVAEAACFGLTDFVKYRIFKRQRPRPKDMFREDTGPPSLAHQAVSKVISFLSVSLAAQVGTAPILYLSFGYFSVVSLLLNCVFVPLMTLCFSPLLLLTLLATLLPAIAGIILYVPNVVIGTLMLPFHVLDFSKGILSSHILRGSAVVCYYCAVLFVSDKINVSPLQRFGTALLFGITFVICLLV